MSINQKTTSKSIHLPLFEKAQQLNIRIDAFGKREVFDCIRKKWVILQPEEMVRQALVNYLVELSGYSFARMAIERGVKGSNTKKRFDVLVYDYALQPFLLVECKAPEVVLKESAFQQISWYNHTIQAPYYLLTNGITTYCCKVNHQLKKISFLSEIPTLDLK